MGELEAMKKDIKLMNWETECVHTAVSLAQKYHDDVKAELGVEGTVTRDEIFEDLFIKDVEELTTLMQATEKACDRESKILSKLQDMSDQSLELQGKYLKGEKGATSLYDH